MDFVDIIITIAILGLGGLLSGRKKGKKTSPQPSAAPRPTARPIFETLFEEDDDVDDEFEEDTFDQVDNEVFDYEEPVATNQANGFQDEYFTYENMSGDRSDEPVQISESMNVIEEPDTDNVFDGAFDVRRAFIYQTILERVNY